MNRRRSIVKCGLIILGLILLVAVLKGVFDVCYYSALEEQRAVLKRVSERVDEKIEKSQRFFQMAVNGQDFLGMSDERRSYTCREVLSYGFSSVQIFDGAMNRVYQADSTYKAAEMAITSDDYKKMLDSRFIMLGKINAEKSSDASVIMLMAIMGERMDYQGAVAASINGREFASLLSKDNFAVQGSYCFMTDEKKFYISSDERYVNDNLPQIYGLLKSDEANPRGPTAYLLKLLAGQNKDVYLEMPIVNTQWHVIAVIPAEALFKYIIAQMLNKGLFLLIIIALIGIVVWNIVQRQELCQAKENIKMEKMKMMMQMSASMAHEIKNPLTSLKGFLQYLYYKQKKEHPEQEKFFSIMFDEVDRIEMLANQFCMMAKPEENIKKEAFVVDEVMEEIYLLTDAQAKKANIVLDYHQFEEPIKIWGNRQQLKQIFINLINNAFDAVTATESANGHVEILCRRSENKCRLEVKDNGIGIKKEDMEKLCTAFYTTKEQGNGLGLMITHELIKQHKGEMHIESEYGKGTSFIVTFPIYQDK